MPDFESLNRRAAAIWDRNARHWDAAMGNGNRFHRELVEPAADRLLGPAEGQRVLDLGCGNGQYARHLAAAGATVHGVDVSQQMIAPVAGTRFHRFWL